MSPTIGPGRMIATSHDEVVEARRLQTRQRGHLRARFHLEDANRVGLLQQVVHVGIVGGKMGEIEKEGGGQWAVGQCRADFRAVPLPPPPCCVHELNGVLQHRHHAEPEQVHFDDAHLGAVVLVPLHDDAAGHRGRLERHDRIELALANHHPA